MLKAIIFDLDGVLIDSFESNYRYFKEVFVKAGYKPLSRAEFRKAFHLTLDDLIDRYVSKGDTKEFRRVYRIAYDLYAIPETPKAQRGSIAAIKKFAGGYKLGIVTGRLKEGVDEYFQNFPVRRFFAAVIHHGHYDNPKPHPEPMLLALKRLKVRPSEAVYIGDALSDIQAASSAGVGSVLFNDKKIGEPDYRVRNFRELIRLIDRISGKK
ncbi:MAG: HAD family hydrolase [Candidatus Saccharibacteria bacterium]